MAETDSEKMIKDTLNRMLNEDKILYKQKANTPRYQKEPIDFIAVDNTGACHLIEVKANKTTTIGNSQFKDHQKEYLTKQELNTISGGSGKTNAWIVAHFYRGDASRRDSNYYEHYFLLPGIYASDNLTISISECRNDKAVTFLGGYEYGEWVKIHEDFGLSTQGNDSKGLKTMHDLFYEQPQSLIKIGEDNG